MKQINSKVFGSIKLLEENDEDFQKMKNLIKKYPANGFGILNKLLNEKGMMIRIGEL